MKGYEPEDSKTEINLNGILISKEDYMEYFTNKITIGIAEHFYKRGYSAETIADVFGWTREEGQPAGPAENTQTGAVKEKKQSSVNKPKEARKYTKVDKDQVIALKRAGWMAKDIAAELKCSDQTVYDIINAYQAENGPIIPEKKKELEFEGAGI